ncbi:hypothetical protein AAFF_G00063940 [Aldrovandia affinis]|uniref:Uncharacterized protein n=1 Tax=Aldrovandia affinis TaxID=143900 RepID=A0AAD7T5D6_9TELE|nr:hypothetical protein AAFF_G00063940 [Aldrovandia affinis]
MISEPQTRRRPRTRKRESGTICKDGRFLALQGRRTENVRLPQLRSTAAVARRQRREICGWAGRLRAHKERLFHRQRTGRAPLLQRQGAGAKLASPSPAGGSTRPPRPVLGNKRGRNDTLSANLSAPAPGLFCGVQGDVRQWGESLSVIAVLR